MNRDDHAPDARPVPVPRAVRDLIRQVAADRGDVEPDPGTNAAADAGTSAPPRDPAAPDTGRRFTVDGEEWIARIAGEGAVGTGSGPAAFLVAVRFYPAAHPETPAREILIPRGRFDSLYDDELRVLFHSARPLPPPNAG
jgi:hypothetical protein